MTRLLRHALFGAPLVVLLSSAAPAAAQVPGQVRVIHGPIWIEGWHRNPQREALSEVGNGTVLEVIGSEGEWLWVITPPDDHRTRRAGWVRAAFVERVPPPAPGSARGDQADEIATSPSVTETATNEVTASPTAEHAAPSAPGPALTFDDVHFDRDAYALRVEERETLRTAAAALKAHPSLVVNIEGHTCNLGATAYNLGLGLRRATAVKDYLVNEGIAADRLHMISLGEAHAKYDNSGEQTRHLNRRVALIPQ
jgi:outer membrane protein OmpA-like peptidoglycan-associated protein